MHSSIGTACARVAQSGARHGPGAALLAAAVGALACTMLRAHASPISLATASAGPALQAAAAAGTPARIVPRFPITRYAVEGASLVPAARLEEALAAFAGPDRTFADIEAAAETVRAVYERAGFVSVQVTIPEQTLSAGVVRLKVEELRVARIEVTETQFRSADNVRRAVPGLVEGRTPSDTELSAQLRLANENPGRQMQVTMRTNPDGTLTAVLRVADRPPRIGQVSVDNTGTPSTGRMRLALALQHMNLLDRDIVGTAQFQTSPRFLEEVRIASLSGRVPLYGRGLMLEASAVHSSVDSGTVRTVAGDYLLASSGLNLSLRVLRLLPRWGTVEPRVWGGLESKLVQSSVQPAGGGPSLVPDIELRPVQLGLSAAWRGTAAAVSGQAVAFHNVPGSGRSAASVFSLPGLRAGAEPRYTVVRAAASASHAWPAGTVQVSWSGQWTPDLLVPAEQFGLGGEGSVRGFDGRVASGDRGQRLSVEWQTPARPWLEGSATELSWVAFLEGGQVRRLQSLPGEVSQATLAGTGVGIRLFRARSFSMRLDVGVVARAEGLSVPRTAFVHAGADYPF